MVGDLVFDHLLEQAEQLLGSVERETPRPESLEELPQTDWHRSVSSSTRRSLLSINVNRTWRRMADAYS